MAEKKSDPTKAPEFQRVLKNLLNTPHKPQVELKIGKRRLLCPDLAMARYLSVFARLGVAEIATPYDITQVSRLADDLESSWYRMLTLVEHLAVEQSARFRNRVLAVLIAEERNGIIEAGAGPAVPQFNQNTKQRKAKL